MHDSKAHGIHCFTGTSDANRVFHTLAIGISTNEDSPIFEFIGNHKFLRAK